VTQEKNHHDSFKKKKSSLKNPIKSSPATQGSFSESLVEKKKERKILQRKLQNVILLVLLYGPTYFCLL
jgi:hypothetical protein